MTRFRFAQTLLVTTALSVAGAAAGQAYPSKPVSLVTGETGGPNDFVSRIIAPGLSKTLPQPVSVDNRGNALISGELVRKAAPDGHTLLVIGSALWLQPYLSDQSPWDPLKDYTPIIMTSRSPAFLVVHPSMPVRSMKELLALAKARPGQIVSGAGPAGSITYMAPLLLQTMAGIDIVRVTYPGNIAALKALMSGETQMLFGTSVAVTHHVRAGRLRALATSSDKPSELMPGLPTVAAAGLPGYEAVSMTGIFGPAGTPAAVVSLLNREIARVLNEPGAKQRLFDSGAEVVADSPGQLTAKMKSEMDRLGRIIRDARARG
jgi:tripartite-type tricarboxylate transporter receptor subunit TctC